MTGDQDDIVLRLKSSLPARWFGEATPVLDALLNGLAAAWVYIYQAVQYTRLQTRISTASESWLDLVAQDFFGAHITRTSGQGDGSFRGIVKRNLLREKATRYAIASTLVDLTGQAPMIFEPANASDTGGYGHFGMLPHAIGGGVAYGINGGWGSLVLPYQSFVTIPAMIGKGVANISGWGSIGGGYCAGNLAYVDINLIQSHITDADLMDGIARVAPAGAIIWVRIVH